MQGKIRCQVDLRRPLWEAWRVKPKPQWRPVVLVLLGM